MDQSREALEASLRVRDWRQDFDDPRLRRVPWYCAGLVDYDTVRLDVAARIEGLVEGLERSYPDCSNAVDFKARELIREFGGWRRAYRGTDLMPDMMAKVACSAGDEDAMYDFYAEVRERIREYGRALPWWRRLLGV